MAAAPTTAHQPLQPGRLLAIGTLAGIYSGLFGVGGGAIMVPLLILWLAFDPREAAATSMAAIAVIATSGTITHTVYGNVLYAQALLIAAPAVIGAVVGTALQQRVPREWISIGLAVLLVFAAVDLLQGSGSTATATSDAGIANAPILIAAGFLAGVLAGLVGIGGGVLFVPALVYAGGLDQRAAIATSLAAIVPASITASLRQRKYGNLRLREGLVLGVLGIAGAAIGATFAEVLPERALRIGFAVMMIVIALQLVHGVRKSRRAEEPEAPLP